MAETPETPTPSLAARLERYGRGVEPVRCLGTLGKRPSWMSPDQYDPCRCELPNGHDGDHRCEHGTEPNRHPGVKGTEPVRRLQSEVDADKLAAAAQLRQLDRIKAELRQEHVPQWSTPEMEARGKDPIGCVMCWPQDGSWPCTTILILEADDGA